MFLVFSIYLCTSLNNFLSRSTVPYLALPFNLVALCSMMVLKNSQLNLKLGHLETNHVNQVQFLLSKSFKLQISYEQALAYTPKSNLNFGIPDFSLTCPGNDWSWISIKSICKTKLNSFRWKVWDQGVKTIKYLSNNMNLRSPEKSQAHQNPMSQRNDPDSCKVDP